MFLNILLSSLLSFFFLVSLSISFFFSISPFYLCPFFPSLPNLVPLFMSLVFEVASGGVTDADTSSKWQHDKFEEILS